VKRARQKFGAHYENEDLKLAPHSMVIHRGHVEKDIRVLVQDFRRVMEPFTATELKATQKNSLKDFISIAGPLHVTHLIMFTQSELNDHLKIARLPRGPTVNFNILEYSHRNDVLSVLKRKQTHQKQYLNQPLLILNGFNTTTSKSQSSESSDTTRSDYHLKLLTATLQNMFPSINVTKIKLDEIRRCVLFNYNKNDNTIDFRQ
jgi:ribosome biogenesis protein SSF1/2